MDPLSIRYVDDGKMDEKKKGRERYRRYYEANRDVFRERNKRIYAEKKERGITEEEREVGRAQNRRSYHRRKAREVDGTLEGLRSVADPSRVALLDELTGLALSKEMLDVVAFIVKKKNSPLSKANEHSAEGTQEGEGEGKDNSGDGHHRPD